MTTAQVVQPKIVEFIIFIFFSFSLSPSLSFTLFIIVYCSVYAQTNKNVEYCSNIKYINGDIILIRRESLRTMFATDEFSVGVREMCVSYCGSFFFGIFFFVSHFHFRFIDFEICLKHANGLDLERASYLYSDDGGIHSVRIIKRRRY